MTFVLTTGWKNESMLFVTVNMNDYVYWKKTNTIEIRTEYHLKVIVLVSITEVVLMTVSYESYRDSFHYLSNVIS